MNFQFVYRCIPGALACGNITVTNDHGYVPFVVITIMSYHRVCNKSNTTGGTYGAGTDYPSGILPRFLVGLIFLGLKFSV